MATEVLNIIEKSRLFGGLSHSLLENVVKVSERMKVSEGELLFQQGDKAEAVWGVISGQVLESIRSEDGNEMIVNSISPGDIFGEVAVLDWGTQRYEAVAAVDSELFRINRRNFLELLQSSPELCFRLFTHLCSHVRGAGEALEDATLQKFPVRLAKKITLLAAIKQGKPDENGELINKGALNISQNDLAHLMGVKRETVNRHLRSWVKEGWLSLGRGKIEIHDMSKLSAVAAPALNGNSTSDPSSILPYPMSSLSRHGNKSLKTPSHPADGIRQVGLLAIVVSDYSHQMMGNAAGTLKSLKEGIHAIEKSVAEANGIIIGQVGDSMVVEFPDGSTAMQTAKVIHKKLFPFMKSVSEKGQSRPLFRIGVHAGKIIVENHRYVGSAIKTTLAVAQYANPGGLYLTGKIKDQLAGNLHEELSFLGNQKFRGLDKTIPVYSDQPITFSKRISALIDSYRRRKAWPAAVSGAAIVVLVMVWLVAGQFQPVALVTIPQNSIAVLPFENLSSDPEDAFYSEGVTFELMQLLAGHGELSIRGRESIQNFTAYEDDLSNIGEALRVAYLLEGSVFKTGYNFNITARLTKAVDGTLVWSGSYDSDSRDLFNVHQSIASKVASALELKNDNLNAASVITPISSSPEAYTLYLKARHHKSLGMTADAIAAIPLLEQAIILDPEFAEAYALLAMFYLGFPPSNQLMPLTEEERQIKIKTFMDKALSLKPNSPRILAGVSAIKWVENDFLAARQLAEQAIAMDPSDADALWSLYLGQWYTGDWVASLNTLEQLLVVEPLSNRVLIQYARFLAWIGKLDEAKDLAERALAISPDPRGKYTLLSSVALNEGDPLKALALSRAASPIGVSLDLWYGDKSFNIADITPDIYKISLYAYAGEYDEARRIINETFSKIPNSADHLINLGEIEILDGNFKEGIELYSRGRELNALGDSELVWPKKLSLIVSGHRKSSPALALMFAYRQTGQDEKAEEIANLIIQELGIFRQKLNSIGGQGANEFLYGEAQFLAIEGHAEAAISALRRWRNLDPGLFNYLRYDPFLAGLHSKPEFWEIVADVEEELEDIRAQAALGLPEV